MILCISLSTEALPNGRMLLYPSHFFSDYIYLDSRKGFCGKHLECYHFSPQICGGPIILPMKIPCRPKDAGVSPCPLRQQGGAELPDR